MKIRLVRIITLCALAAIGLGMRGHAADPSAAGPDPVREAAAVGDVVGTVTLAAAGQAAPPMLSPYARRRYTPPASPQSSGSPDNVVLYIVVSGGTPAPSGGQATILQRDRTIIPHTTAISAGTRVDFPNGDEVFHNLFSLSGPKPFNLGRYAPGTSRTVTFERAGTVRVFCDIHSEMSATIVVLDTPYFTRADESGAYRISGVPEGRHILVAWHESAGTSSTPIVVSAGRPTRVDISLPAGS